MSSCSEGASELKGGFTGLQLLLKPLALEQSETNLTSHHVNIGKHGLMLACGERFNVRGGNKGAPIISINVHGTEVEVGLLVWIGEVY